MDTSSPPSHALSSQRKPKKDKPSTISDNRSGANRPPEQRLPRQSKAQMMIRPTHAQKACVERVAEQVGMKRSYLDGTFYLMGALLTGVERLNTSEAIGTWSPKEVAAYFKQTFTSLFELLYEQDELPLTFALLIERSTTVQVPIVQHDQEQSTPREAKQNPVLPVEADLEPFFSADAEVNLDGFPEDI